MSELQWLWRMGLAGPRHVESSQTRDQTHVSYVGRQILNHCTPREVLRPFAPAPFAERTVLVPLNGPCPLSRSADSVCVYFWALLYLTTCLLVHLPELPGQPYQPEARPLLPSLSGAQASLGRRCRGKGGGQEPHHQVHFCQYWGGMGTERMSPSAE